MEKIQIFDTTSCKMLTSGCLIKIVYKKLFTDDKQNRGISATMPNKNCFTGKTKNMRIRNIY